MHTELCDRLNIDVPIFAFSHCRDVVAAVSKAGGFGVLGAGTYTPHQLREELNWLDEHVGGKKYGVDIVLPHRIPGLPDEPDVDKFTALLWQQVPEEYREFAERLLREHGVPEWDPTDPVRVLGSVRGGTHS